MTLCTSPELRSFLDGNLPGVTPAEMRYRCILRYGDYIATMTVEEMRSRGDATDTSSTFTEIKRKRPYKRKHPGGDHTTAGASTAIEIKKKRPYRRKMHLPHDLIVEQILTRLPVPTLLTSVLVSKLWYNSIHNDRKRLTYSHFLQSQKQPRVVFSLLNVVRHGVTTLEDRYGCHFFKFTTGVYKDETLLEFDTFRSHLTHLDTWELVGYCRGLPCLALVGCYSTNYVIPDPNRKDFLCIFYPARLGRRVYNAGIICHGFGFDSSANEYKVVSVYRTAHEKLNFVVFTLGTKSWRDVTATSTPMSSHDGRTIIEIRAPTGSDKSAIFCTSSSNSSSGCLVWKIIATLGGEGSNNIQHDKNNNEMEMLLSFNLHDEKFQLIQLPPKYTTDGQQEHLLVDYPHLLEFKGSPCIARIGKASGNGSDYPCRCHDNHRGCCCCCKVHLYILKDKVEQLWVEEESFDVRLNSTPKWLSKQAPDPCCFCFGSTTTTPPTRIFSFSDQMLLYWFNGKYLQVYNLRSENYQLVQPSGGDERGIFQAKIKRPRNILNSDDDIRYPKMDYQLHCHEENFLSLEAFIPEGVTGVAADNAYWLHSPRAKRLCSTYVYIYRGSNVFYPSFSN